MRKNLFLKETAVKRQLLILCAMWLSLAGPGFGQVETKVKVVGQRVNLRAKADMQAEVVGQIADGEFLNARSFQDDWVEVAPPASVELWVHREFIKDNQVIAPKLYVRGGPGINYTAVGTLMRGDTITPKGDFGEWIKIVPPAVCSLWVNRSYVQVLQPEKSKPVLAQKPAAEQPVKMAEQSSWKERQGARYLHAAHCCGIAEGGRCPTGRATSLYQQRSSGPGLDSTGGTGKSCSARWHPPAVRAGLGQTQPLPACPLPGKPDRNDLLRAWQQQPDELIARPAFVDPRPRVLGSGRKVSRGDT